jgi:hypothetical protein
MKFTKDKVGLRILEQRYSQPALFPGHADKEALDELHWQDNTLW